MTRHKLYDAEFYAATGSVTLLQQAQVQISMAARGRPTENAYAERFMRTL